MTSDNELKKIIEDCKNRQKKLYEILGEDFLKKMKEYIHSYENLDELSASEKLFLIKSNDFKIKPVFEIKNKITHTENSRHRNNSLIATYYFNDPEFTDRPLRLDITAQVKDIPQTLQDLRYNGYIPRNCIDIELFERIPIEYDLKNFNVYELINEYLENEEISIEDIESIEPISALQEVEKFHMKFLVFENNMFFPIYLGIGSNEPYNFPDKKGSHGKNRFYRYSMEGEAPFEQISELKSQHLDIDLSDDALFYEISSDRNIYFFHNEVGTLIYTKEKGYKKVILEQPIRPLNVEDIFKNEKFKLIESHLHGLFPQYENYTYINFDPLERVNSKGHKKSIQFLYEKKLLGLGYQDKINVASDFFLSGYDDDYRLKIISLFLLRSIKNKWLEKLVINKSMNSQPPLAKDMINM